MVLFYTGAGATDRHPAPVSNFDAVLGRADATVGSRGRERGHRLWRGFRCSSGDGSVTSRYHRGNKGTEAGKESASGFPNPGSNSTERRGTQEGYGQGSGPPG